MRARVRYDGEGTAYREHAIASRCGKLAYSTMKRAKEAAAIRRRETGEDIRAYHCWSPCHAFHIGHPPTPFDFEADRARAVEAG